MTYTVTEIIDAIAGDLRPVVAAAALALANEELGGLGSALGPNGYTEWLYKKPNTLQAENAPWLAIFSPSSRHELISTMEGRGEYMDNDEVVVEFAVSIGQTADMGGQGAPAIARAAIEAAIPILERLRTYASGLPAPFTDQVVGTLRQTDRGDERSFAFVQSWTLIVNSTGAQ
jgi:hypothetical protein